MTVGRAGAAPIASNDPARASVTVSLTGTGAGRALTFDAGGVQRSTVELTPAWETSSPKGHNAGSAGIAFADPHNRGQAGGQIARNIRVLAAR